MFWVSLWYSIAQNKKLDYFATLLYIAYPLILL